MNDKSEKYTLEYTDQGLTYFDKHVENNRRHVKRSLLDFIDYQFALLPPDEQKKFEKLHEILKRRVHNEISSFENSVLTGLRLWLRGGDIPPFGIPDFDNRPVSNNANGGDRRPHPQR